MGSVLDRSGRIKPKGYMAGRGTRWPSSPRGMMNSCYVCHRYRYSSKLNLEYVLIPKPGDVIPADPALMGGFTCLLCSDCIEKHPLRIPLRERNVKRYGHSHVPYLRNPRRKGAR